MRKSLALRMINLMKMTGRKPKRYFVRYDVWKEVRDSFIDRSFAELRELFGKPLETDYASSDPDCPFTNFFLLGIPVCIIPDI